MQHNLDSLIGFEIKALDGEIGHCKDFLFDDQFWTVRYMVADTGSWLTDKKVLISPMSINRLDLKNRNVETDLAGHEIEQSPLLDEDAPVSRQYEIRWARHYGIVPYWAGPFAWGPSAFPIRLATHVRRDDIVEDADGDQDKNLRSAREILGYKISASDGSIGHIEDFIIDDDTWTIRYTVIDTRNWLPGGRKVLISHLWIEFIDWSERKVWVNLTKEKIANSPLYDPSATVSRACEERL